MLCHSLLAGQDHRPGTVKAEVQVLLLMGMQGLSSTCQEAAYLLLGGQGEVGVHTSNIDMDGLQLSSQRGGKRAFADSCWQRSDCVGSSLCASCARSRNWMPRQLRR